MITSRHRLHQLYVLSRAFEDKYSASRYAKSRESVLNQHNAEYAKLLRRGHLLLPTGTLLSVVRVCHVL